jgi:hypothetical protein
VVAEEDLSALSASKHEAACVRLVLAIEGAMGTSEDDAAQRLFKKDPKAWLELGPAKWRKESRVEVDGHMEHGGTIEIQCPATRETIAAGLVELHQIGIDFNEPRAFRQLAAPSGGNGEEENESAPEYS